MSSLFEDLQCDRARIDSFIQTCLIPAAEPKGEQWKIGDLLTMFRRWATAHGWVNKSNVQVLGRRLREWGYLSNQPGRWYCRPREGLDFARGLLPYLGRRFWTSITAGWAMSRCPKEWAPDQEVRLDLMDGAGAMAIRDLLNENEFDMNEDPLDLRLTSDELEAYGDLLADLRKDRRARLEWARDRRAMSKTLGL